MKQLLLLLALISPSFAQLPVVDYAGMFFQVSPAQPIRKVASLPATCTAVGAASSSNAVLYQGRVYQCTATNTWSFAVGQTAALTAGRLPYVGTGGVLTDSANATLDSSGNIAFNTFTMPNNAAMYQKDSGGTARRIWLLTAANDIQLGTIDAGWGSGAGLILRAAGYVRFSVNNGTSAVNAGFISAGGLWSLATSDLAIARLGVVAPTSSTVAGIFRGASSQTANLIENQDSSATFLSGFDASGRLRYATSLTQSTVGAAGGASALPATPTGYIKINVNGTEVIIPYYAAS